jgi:hypothetical protein
VLVAQGFNLVQGVEDRAEHSIVKEGLVGVLTGADFDVVAMHPDSLAGMFGFKAKEGFKAEAGAEKAPEVKF